MTIQRYYEFSLGFVTFDCTSIFNFLAFKIYYGVEIYFILFIFWVKKNYIKNSDNDSENVLF